MYNVIFIYIIYNAEFVITNVIYYLPNSRFVGYISVRYQYDTILRNEIPL